MKKVFYSVGCLVLSVLLITGCGSEKKLECTMTGEQSGIKNDQKINVSFKDDKTTKVSLDMKMIVPEEAVAYMGMLKSTLEEQFADFNKGEDKGSKFDIITNNNEIKLSLTADTDKMDNETKSKLGITTDKSSLADVKKELEEQGYTCK